MQNIAEEYALQDVQINALDITRTFLDKILAVKRHATCGTISSKVRHIYDVTVLYERDDIQRFLSDADTLKELLTRQKKPTDSILKREVPPYNTILLVHMIFRRGGSTSMIAFDVSMKSCTRICSTLMNAKTLTKRLVRLKRFTIFSYRSRNNHLSPT